MQNTNNDLINEVSDNFVGDASTASAAIPATNSVTNPGTNSANLQTVSETTEATSLVISPDNVVIKKDALVTEGIVEEEGDEKSSDELDTSTTKIEDREEDSESYMDDTVDY